MTNQERLKALWAEMGLKDPENPSELITSTPEILVQFQLFDQVPEDVAKQFDSRDELIKFYRGFKPAGKERVYDQFVKLSCDLRSEALQPDEPNKEFMAEIVEAQQAIINQNRQNKPTQQQPVKSTMNPVVARAFEKARVVNGITPPNDSEKAPPNNRKNMNSVVARAFDKMDEYYNLNRNK